MAQRNIAVRFSVEDAEKVRAALQAIGKDGEDALKKLDRAAAAQPGLKALDKGVDDVKSKLRDFAGQLGPVGSVLSALGPAGLVAAAGIGALGVAVNASLKAAADAQQSYLRLEAVIKATGNSIGLTADQANDFADELARSTLASGNSVRQAEGVLATFGVVAGENFKEVIKLAQDYAAVFGGDLVSATQLFGKALQDPVRGIETFRRANIALSDAQKEQIRVFAQSGETFRAAGILIDAVRDKVGGAGAAEASGLVGATHRLDEAWQHFKESLGGQFLDSVTSKLTALAAVLDKLSHFAPQASAALNAGLLSLPGGGLLAGNPLADAKKEQERQQAISLQGDPQYAAAVAQAQADAQLALNLQNESDKAQALARSLNSVDQAREENLQKQKALNDEIARGGPNVDALIQAVNRLKKEYEDILYPVQAFFKAQEEALSTAGLTGAAKAKADAQNALLKTLPNGLSAEEINAYLTKAGDIAVTKYGRDQAGGIADNVQQLQLQAAGLQKVAQAYAQSTEAGEKAELQLRAEVESRHAGSAAAASLYAAYLKEYEGKKLVESVKLVQQTQQEADAAEKLAAAAAKGPAEFRRVTIELQVLQKVQAGVFKEGSQAAKDYQAALERIDVAKVTSQWAQANNDLKDQNQLLGLEVSLIGQRPELISKEIALLQVKQQAIKDGLDPLSQEVQDRLQLVAAQSDLNARIAEAKKQEELLIEPIKNLIGNIQDGLANAYLSVFDKSARKGQSLYKSLIDGAKQAAAQILAALTVTPIIRMVFEATGLNNTALGAALGLSGSTGGAATGGGAGGVLSALTGGSGAGGGSVLNQSLFSRLLGGNGGTGGIGSFLSTPIAQLFGGGPTGAAAQALGAGGGFFGNLSIGQGLGVLGGGISGILQLTQGNYIGGITSLIGAGVSLIPGIGQIAGPLIALAGSLLGGLFQKKPPHAQAQLLTAPLGTLTDGPSTPFQGRDFTYTNPFGVLGYAGAGTNSRFDDPEGAAGDFLKAVNDIDKAIASLLTTSQIATVSHALQSTPGLKTDFKKFDNEGFDIELDRLQTTLKALYGSSVANTAFQGIQRGNDHVQELAQRAADVVAFAKSIDQLGKSVTDAETAVTAIKDQFGQLKTQATQYGFGQATLDKIDAQQKAALNKVASDFNDTVSKGLLGLTDPNALALQNLQEDQAKRLANAQYLVDQYNQHQIDVLVDINKLEEEFGKEREALVQQQLQAIGTSWRDFFDELTLGPLSALSPTAQHAQALGRYNDIVAQLGIPANANDPTLLAQYQDAARNALAAERSYSGAGGATADLYAQILAFVRQQGSIPGFAGGTDAAGYPLGYTGLAVVGENGPELVRFRRPGQVLPANAVRQAYGALGGAGGGDGLASLRDELRALRGDFANLLQAIVSGNVQLVRAFVEQAAAQNRSNNEMRAMSTRRAASGR